jgi:hypothetical protein
MKLIFICFLLLFSACSFKVTDCEFKPSASINEEFDIEKPIQDQINPETKVSCNY